MNSYLNWEYKFIEGLIQILGLQTRDITSTDPEDPPVGIDFDPAVESDLLFFASARRAWASQRSAATNSAAALRLAFTSSKTSSLGEAIRLSSQLS